MIANFQVRIEAAKCLGELGPNDLKTLSLKSDFGFHCRNDDTPLHRLLSTALRILSNLIVDDNLEVRKRSSNALHALLSTNDGDSIYLEGKSRFKNLNYLMPFRGWKKNDLKMKVNQNIFLKNVNNAKSWAPQEHKTWITGLVKSFLTCFFDSSKVVQSFQELCEISSYFSEQVFPIIMDLILSLEEEEYNSVISSNINKFFHECLKNIMNEPQGEWNQTSVQCLIDAVDYLRIQRNYEHKYRLILSIAHSLNYCGEK